MGKRGAKKAALVFLAGMSLCFSAAFCQENADNRQETEDFDFANGLLSRGMYDMATSAYEQFLTKYPESRYAQDARYRMAETWFLQKNNEKALTEFTRFISETPSKPLAVDAKLRIGQIKYIMGDSEGAAAKFNEVLAASVAKKETVETAEYYLAEILMRTGNRDRARAAFEAFIQKYEEGPYAGFSSLNLGDIYLEEKDFRKAAESYRRAADSPIEDNLKDEARLREAEALNLAGEKEKALLSYTEILRASAFEAIRDRAAIGIIAVNYSGGDMEKTIETASGLIPGIKGEEAACRARFILANSYLNAERFQEAADTYSGISGKCPGEEVERRAKLNRCWALYKLSDFYGCVKELDSYLNSYPREDADEAVYLKGKAFWAMGKRREALEQYDLLLSKYKDSDFRQEILYDKGWAHYQSGEVSQAIAAHALFVKEFPRDERSPGVLLKSAQEELERGNSDKAVGLYKKFLSDYPEDSQKQPAMYQMARAFYESGKYSDAIDTYSGILEQSPGPEVRGNVLYWRAVCYQKEEKWEKALADFNEAAAQGGEIAVKALEASAFSLFQKGDKSAAASAYYDIISGSEKAPEGLRKEIYLWTAEFYTENREHEKAMEILKAMGKTYPEGADSDALYLMGENSRLAGKEQQAVTYFEKAVSAGAVSPRKERCYLGMGRALAALGESDKALKAFEEALSGDRDNVTGAIARMETGEIYSAKGDHVQAARQYAMVAILYADAELSPKALFSAAESFKKAGMKEDSEKMFRELEEKYPEHPFARLAREKYSGS